MRSFRSQSNLLTQISPQKDAFERGKGREEILLTKNLEGVSGRQTGDLGQEFDHVTHASARGAAQITTAQVLKWG